MQPVCSTAMLDYKYRKPIMNKYIPSALNNQNQFNHFSGISEQHSGNKQIICGGRPNKVLDKSLTAN